MARLIRHNVAAGTGRSWRLTARRCPRTFLESELFGYERGAFTGAQQTKPGQVEIAAAGGAVPRRSE